LPVADSKTNLNIPSVGVADLCPSRLGETRLPEALSGCLSETHLRLCAARLHAPDARTRRQDTCTPYAAFLSGKQISRSLSYPSHHIVKVAYRAFSQPLVCVPNVAHLQLPALLKPCPGSSLHLALLQQKASKFHRGVATHVSMPWVF
jgi:hypothetical protein